MDEPRFYQKPWFYILSRTIVLLGIYAYAIQRLGGWEVNATAIPRDVLLVVVLLLIWLAFFAQFVLPVRSLRDRQSIFARLLAYILKFHGPALFVRDGRLVKGEEEEKKRGPGVIWLDTASAAVIRTPVRFSRAIGPGVHFLAANEKIAGTVDLHLQVHTIGPHENDRPFDAQTKDQSTENFTAVQNRRMETSALTRDGIEVVPNIMVIFKIDADPAPEGKDGSRFGYDAAAVFKAVAGEGINPDAPPDAPRYRVAWNRLPAMLAADLWREYLGKYTLDELFSTEVPAVPAEPTAAPRPEETSALFAPRHTTPGSGLGNALAGMLHEINRLLGMLAERCEKGRQSQAQPEGAEPPASFEARPEAKEPGRPDTGLQIINRMVRARLTQPKVIQLDDRGRPNPRILVDSPEYELLKKRGIRVIAVSITSLRFTESVEEHLVRLWTASWLLKARTGRDLIEERRAHKRVEGQEAAKYRYAEALSHALLRACPEQEMVIQTLPALERLTKQKEAIKALLTRSRQELIRRDRMHRRLSTEREGLEDILKWVENGS